MKDLKYLQGCVHKVDYKISIIFSNEVSVQVN